MRRVSSKQRAVSGEKLAVSCKRGKAGGRKILLFCLLLTAYCSLACSVPKLESAECTEARIAVREFYSQHFGGEMRFSPENLKERQKFLTDELVKTLPDAPTDRDPFTLTDDLPRTFRVGGCETSEAGRRVGFEVLLFWKTDTRSEQREIRVEAVKQGDKWLINKISN